MSPLASHLTCPSRFMFTASYAAIVWSSETPCQIESVTWHCALRHVTKRYVPASGIEGRFWRPWAVPVAQTLGTLHRSEISSCRPRFRSTPCRWWHGHALSEHCPWFAAVLWMVDRTPSRRQAPPSGMPRPSGILRPLRVWRYGGNQALRSWAVCLVLTPSGGGLPVEA
jgi:hypothetical protein